VNKGLFCVSTIVGICQVHPAYTLAPASFQHVSSATHHVVIPYLPSAIVRPNVDRPQLPASAPSASAQTIPTAGTPALPWYHTIWPADMLPSRPRPRQPAPVSLQIPTASQAYGFTVQFRAHSLRVRLMDTVTTRSGATSSLSPIRRGLGKYLTSARYPICEVFGCIAPHS
jgi:hypothetical protein